MKATAFKMLASSTTLAICACTENGSNTAPPINNSPVKLITRPSSVIIPISASLLDIQRKLNEDVPNPLYKVDDHLSKCIPAQYTTVCAVPKLTCKWFKCRKSGCNVPEVKTKISPDISCDLKGNITRGDIQLGGAGQTLSMFMPVHIDVSAKNIGGVIKSETAKGSADVRANAALDINEDWIPVGTVNADYSWNDRIGVDVFGQRVTFASKVDPKVREAIAKFRNGLPSQLEALNLRDSVAGAWTKGFTAVELSADPPAWLRLTPTAIGFSGYEIQGDRLTLTLMANGVTETFIGSKPHDPAPRPLPKLVKSLPQPGFQFYLPVLASYASLEDAAEKALQVGEKQKFPTKLGEVQVTFESVTLYPTNGGALAVGIKLDADPPNQFFDTEGTVWLKAAPRIDNAKRTIWFDQFEPASSTDNPGFDLLISILRSPWVNERLRKALRYDFSLKYAAALAKANAALNRDLSDGWHAHGQITNAEVDRIVATPQGIFMGIAVLGDLRLDYGQR